MAEPRVDAGASERPKEGCCDVASVSLGKRWRIHPHDASRVAALAQAANVSPVLAQLLLARGIAQPDAVRSMLECRLTDLRSPELLPGCEAAAAVLHQAIRDRQRIVIHGDYDVDGMTGTAIMWLCLRMLGAEVSYYVPHRIDEGYGLSSDTLRELARQASVIVTVDCGIASVEPARVAAELGVQLVITDHHEPGPELPVAAAIVHPRLPGGNYPFGQLSGAGVALKLAWALCQQVEGAKRVSPRLRDFLLQAVGLAAMGTVADVVPLLDENRVLVKHGLASLAQRPTLGLSTLMQLAGLTGKTSLAAEDVAFTLAPQLNAAGRLGQPQLGVELLVTDRADRAMELAQYIRQLNENRQTLERSIYLAASKQIREQCGLDQPAYVLADRGWHGGVIGIVAGRLAERFHRPVVLVALDPTGIKPGIGSGRSALGFNLHQGLAACGHLLVSHGGHAAAAGLKIVEENVDRFRSEFCDVASGHVTGGDAQPPDLCIDAEVALALLTMKTVEHLDQLAPFGHGNPSPLLCASGLTLVEPPKPIGKGQRHLSLKFAQDGAAMRAVAFGAADRVEELSAGGVLDVAFSPKVNEYRGYRSVQLEVADWRPTRSA